MESEILLEGEEDLQNEANLLAFSHGVDSTALFHLLKERNISFDLAFVNYHTRDESDLEEKAAVKLAKRNNKKIFIKHASLVGSNFEKNARDIRYTFFDELMLMNDYKNLILAHQLNDNLEWLFMQLGKGCGLLELLGMEVKTRKNTYNIIRPLINTSRKALKKYLFQNGLEFFEDKSNEDSKYLRNKIRKDFANDFLDIYENGARNSIKYLRKDSKLLFKELKEYKGLIICPKNESLLAKAAKYKGVLLSSKQRSLAMQADGVFSHKLGVCHYKDIIFVFLYEKVKMPKDFKDLCRKNKIPVLLRPYLYKNHINLENLLKNL